MQCKAFSLALLGLAVISSESHG